MQRTLFQNMPLVYKKARLIMMADKGQSTIKPRMHNPTAVQPTLTLHKAITLSLFELNSLSHRHRKT